MEKKRIIARWMLLLALSLLGTGLQAQNDDLPQVFSPNAAELGKYGKIPVSYFNGLPNISIPLTELRAKGYTLPIYLTYHAGGNKPEQHPGWVGLGWTLHAGGCISRVAHGYRDELGETESDFMNSGKGYLYYANDFQQATIDSTFLIQRLSGGLNDLNPDEFLVNFEGLNSSFYLMGGNSVKIVSESAIDYSVELEFDQERSLPEFNHLPIFAQQFDSIRSIRITTSDGVVYLFGGTDNALDYSYEQVSSPGGGSLLKRTVDTWNITSIQFPGGEEISFEYVKGGRPIIYSDRYFYAHSSDNPKDPGSLYGFTTYSEPSYSLISPSYLQRISSKMSGEELDFVISPTTELVDTLDTSDFTSKNDYVNAQNLAGFVANNYYQKLNRIDTPRGRISFTYTASLGERLKLLSVTIGNPSAGKYEMTYNSLLLPGYHSRKTDMWGYYSQIQAMDETGYYHPVDTVSVLAEILEVLRYPTGGETRFDYEVHHYGKMANQYPFSLTTVNGISGGLRIKKITDVINESENAREYHYVNEDGGSSGISAIKPRFVADGEMYVVPREFEEEDALSLDQLPPGVDVITYNLRSERPLNQIPRTKGSHVTYSRIEERFSDSSKIVYQYTNHEDYPDSCFRRMASTYDDDGLYNSYCSHELSRGLLKQKTYYSAGSASPVYEEEYDYYRDLSDNLQAIEDVVYCYAILHRSALVLRYSYFPGLHHKTVTSYPDDGGSPHTEITEYTYDSHRRLTETKRTVGGVTERETFSYTGNYSAQPYAGMKAKNMIAYPVEHLKLRKDNPQQADQVVSAELTTWKQSDTLYIPALKYRAALGSGIPLSEGSSSGFHPLDTTGLAKDSSYGDIPELSFTKYDANGNLVLSEDRTGLPTTYVWTENGCHPAAIFTGAKMSYSQRDSSDVTHNEQVDLEVGNRLIRDFECMEPFMMTLDLTCPQGQNWHLSVIIDNDEYPLTVINSLNHQGVWSMYGRYPSYRQFTVPSGTHRLNVFVRPTYYAEQGSDPIGCTLMFSYKDKQNTIYNYSGQTVLFEDFEQDGNVTTNGYCSEKSHQGQWSHALDDYGGSYVLDYRVFRNGTWNYVRQSATGLSVSINEGTAPIDHIRVYPEGCLPESYTWDAAGNLLSKTDARGITESYEYDGLGRLVFIRDNDGNYVEHYEYNYQNR